MWFIFRVTCRRECAKRQVLSLVIFFVYAKRSMVFGSNRGPLHLVYTGEVWNVSSLNILLDYSAVFL